MDNLERALDLAESNLECVSSLVNIKHRQEVSIDTLSTYLENAYKKEAKLKLEIDRLNAREGNVSITLAYSTKNSTFEQEKLQIIDVGVSDNVYIVESKVLNSLQNEVDRLKSALIEIASGTEISTSTAMGMVNLIANQALRQE